MTTEAPPQALPQAPPQELFDWLLNSICLRGSRPNDQGVWFTGSAAPSKWNPESRILELADGKRFLLKKETASKALNLDRKSEQVLAALPLLS